MIGHDSWSNLFFIFYYETLIRKNYPVRRLSQTLGTHLRTEKRFRVRNCKTNENEKTSIKCANHATSMAKKDTNAKSRKIRRLPNIPPPSLGYHAFDNAANDGVWPTCPTIDTNASCMQMMPRPLPITKPPSVASSNLVVVRGPVDVAPRLMPMWIDWFAEICTVFVV